MSTDRPALTVWVVCELPAGGAHSSPPRGAGQGAGGEELLPAGEGQDPGLLGNLQEEPGGDEGRAEEQTKRERGGGGAPPSGDHCELHAHLVKDFIFIFYWNIFIN